jgi:hypothetical protein
MHTKFWSENLKGRDNLEVLGIAGRIKLICILGKQGGRVLTGFIWLRIETSGSSFKQSNEPLGSIRGREFLDLLSDY